MQNQTGIQTMAWILITVTIWIPNTWNPNIWLFGQIFNQKTAIFCSDFRPPFENLTIWQQDTFGPFDYQTCPAFRCFFCGWRQDTFDYRTSPELRFPMCSDFHFWDHTTDTYPDEFLSIDERCSVLQHLVQLDLDVQMKNGKGTLGQILAIRILEIQRRQDLNNGHLNNGYLCLVSNQATKNHFAWICCTLIWRL